MALPQSQIRRITPQQPASGGGEILPCPPAGGDPSGTLIFYLRALESFTPAEEIQGPYQSIIDLLRREYRYSQALLQFLQDHDVSRFLQRLETQFNLDQEEKEISSEVLREFMSGKPLEDLRTLRDEFFNRHIMVDWKGRHFADFHREIMEGYDIKTDCRCIDPC